ncbi:pyridoxamine 5'-phosphate oxidase [Gammaproteobacteria bacterium]|nr:pyridoxamine 5'-phosphate oxidase [Gammaproteobacteria bacterium]
MPNRDLSAMREHYQRGALRRADLHDDPLDQFSDWLDTARAGHDEEPNAMHLATVDADGRPSGRVVLLKGLDHGLHFFTNYRSRKGQQLADRPLAAATFWWPSAERQVRIEGTVERLDAATSDAYFASRPPGSQLGAAVSKQSEAVDDYHTLEARYQALIAEHGDQGIARPAHWGGYRLLGERFEFWQGRPSRLHDRFAFIKINNGWQIQRLEP